MHFDLSDPDSLKTWRAVKSRRLGASSVAFVPHDSVPFDDGRGFHHRINEVTELSLVPVPANAEATLVECKRLSRKQVSVGGATMEGGGPRPPIVIR